MTKIKNIPPNRRLIGSKWVFNKNIDSQFTAFLVAKRYAKTPGFDFTERYSPVLSDVALHFILLLWLVYMWYS